jgi:hypothetical protein
MVVLHDFYAGLATCVISWRRHANTLLRSCYYQCYRYARYDIKNVLLTRTIHILPRYCDLDGLFTHAFEAKKPPIIP